eukprot:554434-Rhodomonas_salina.1
MPVYMYVYTHLCLRARTHCTSEPAKQAAQKTTRTKRARQKFTNLVGSKVEKCGAGPGTLIGPLNCLLDPSILPAQSTRGTISFCACPRVEMCIFACEKTVCCVCPSVDSASDECRREQRLTANLFAGFRSGIRVPQPTHTARCTLCRLNAIISGLAAPDHDGKKRQKKDKKDKKKTKKNRGDAQEFQVD